MPMSILQCLALSILWTLHSVPITLKHSSSYFLSFAQIKVPEIMRAAFQLIRVVNSHSVELRVKVLCPDLYSRDVDKCKSAAQVRRL